MFFHQPMGFSLQLFQIGAGLFQHLLFNAASSFLFFENPLVLLLLRAGTVAFQSQAIELQPRHR